MEVLRLMVVFLQIMRRFLKMMDRITLEIHHQRGSLLHLLIRKVNRRIDLMDHPLLLLYCGNHLLHLHHYEDIEVISAQEVMLPIIPIYPNQADLKVVYDQLSHPS